MKVIFLDIDGVLNSTAWNDTHASEISNGNYIDEEKVKLLSEIIKYTDAIIVMHSGWRFWLNDKLEAESKEAALLISIFKKYGIALFDKTPDFSTVEIRKSKKFSLVKAGEIFSWLKSHKEVENYLILDDLYLHNDEITKRQIQTNAIIGLTEQDVIQAISFLNSKPEV